MVHQARRAAEFGLTIPTVEVDFQAVLERAKRIVTESRNGLKEGLENSDNPKLLCGHAKIESREANRFLVRINDHVVTAIQVVIDTGTRSLIPPIEGLDEVDFIHSENWLERTDLPNHLAIIGGGYVGLEMGQFYRRMGSRVTVIEESGQIVNREDEDVAQALQELLESDGVEFQLNSQVKRVSSLNADLMLKIERRDGPQQLEASHVFVATGRKPNTDQLGLETIGVEVSDDGIVAVNERLATNVKGIWQPATYAVDQCSHIHRGMIIVYCCRNSLETAHTPPTEWCHTQSSLIQS
jgi:pyruvate/2-oxoglutarate dehydrogenase complex dihydrolipoamide dehydrogenase (E3) component